MTDPFLVILEELKADVASFRDRADALIANREKVPPTLSNEEQAIRAERLKLALLAASDDIWSMVEPRRIMIDQSLQMLMRTVSLWTTPLNEFAAELDEKITKFRGT